MRFLIAVAAVCTALSGWAWGQKGHDVTAYIAEQHLTPEARAMVDSLLEGKSMVYWANWLDNASHTPEYAYTKTWHYKNVNEGVRYEEMAPNPAGDAVLAIRHAIEVLSDPASSEADRQLYLKILVHVTGDLHQPMHMGHATDLGGNRIKVKYFGRDANLHGIWDTNLVESAHKWSYSEWQQQIDRASEAEQQAITAGTVDDWAKECVAIADTIYKATPAGTDLRYDEIARWSPVIEQQLLRAGLRLAAILNSLAAQ